MYSNSFRDSQISFSGFSNLIKKIGESPMFELERQAKARSLKVAFKVVEKREASLFKPTLYVVEVSLTRYHPPSLSS